MTDINNGSANAGSSIGGGVPNPNSFGGALGETQKDAASQINPDQVKELESLVGRQGQELGEFRKFFQDISPLLDKLDKSPEIVQAILNDNVTADLAKAAMEGKISVSDAQVVSKAHAEVKKDLGKEGYVKTDSEDISRLVEEKVKEIRTEFEGKLKERDELTSFESETQDFIARTPDFTKYASEIDKWLDEHDNVTDISVAYYAIKGELSEREAKKQAEIDLAEHQKGLALNSAGGGNRATHIASDQEAVDQLIGGKTNPNSF